MPSLPVSPHPEIAAVNAIYLALRELPNKASRQRAISFVTQLLDDEEIPPTKLHVVEPDSSAAD